MWVNDGCQSPQECLAFRLNILNSTLLTSFFFMSIISVLDNFWVSLLFPVSWFLHLLDSRWALAVHQPLLGAFNIQWRTAEKWCWNHIHSLLSHRQVKSEILEIRKWVMVFLFKLGGCLYHGGNAVFDHLFTQQSARIYLVSPAYGSTFISFWVME